MSQTEAELSLFSEVVASNKVYSRIHLISGQDLPLKSLDDIFNFFERNSEYEFINSRYANKFVRRLKYYHFFVRRRRENRLYEMCRKILIALQMAIGVDRLKDCNLNFRFGANWCSLTQKAVRYIVEAYPHYKDVFEWTTSSDELYKQMLLDKAGGEFKISPQGDLRYVHFLKGKNSPQILTIKDYESIITSDCLFARKFDYEKQPEIVDKILKHIEKPNV